MSLIEDGIAEYSIDRLFTGLQLQPDEVEKPQLPPEIIEVIIDEVASQKDEDTLKSCLQVARSFVYPAQKHIFESINLVPPAGRSGRRKAQKFWFHLLKSSPHIGVHVRELVIGGDTTFQCYLPEKCKRSSRTTCTWIICAAANAVILLPQILPLLTNLRSFTFSFREEEPRSWLEIPESSRSALGRLLQAGSLDTVKLGFITNLTSEAFTRPPNTHNLTNLTSEAFTRLPNTHNLVLINVTMDEEVTEKDIRGMCSAAERINFWTLTFSVMPPSTNVALKQVLAGLPPLGGCICWSELCIVTCSDETGFCHAVLELVEAAGDIRRFGGLPGYRTDPTLIEMRHISCHDDEPLYELLRFLKDIPSQAFFSYWIKYLIIICPPLNTEILKPKPGWATLDDMLSRPGLACLGKVSIKMGKRDEVILIISPKDVADALKGTLQS